MMWTHWIGFLNGLKICQWSGVQVYGGMKLKRSTEQSWKRDHLTQVWILPDILTAMVTNVRLRLSELTHCAMGTQRNGFSKRETFILSVDVGTTSIRCHVYDKSASIRGSCSMKVNDSSLTDLQDCASAFQCVKSDSSFLVTGVPTLSSAWMGRDWPWGSVERVCDCSQRSSSRSDIFILALLSHKHTAPPKTFWTLILLKKINK